MMPRSAAPVNSGVGGRRGVEGRAASCGTLAAMTSRFGGSQMMDAAAIVPALPVVAAGDGPPGDA